MALNYAGKSLITLTPDVDVAKLYLLLHHCCSDKISESVFNTRKAFLDYSDVCKHSGNPTKQSF